MWWPKPNCYMLQILFIKFGKAAVIMIFEMEWELGGGHDMRGRAKRHLNLQSLESFEFESLKIRGEIFAQPVETIKEHW